MDLYVVLGLTRDATTADIKRAYRRLARQHHPDINPGDREAERRFEQIVKAYEVLGDPARRCRYDETGPAGESEPCETATFGFEGFDFSVGAVSGPRAPTFGDLFAEVFQRAGPRAPRGGAARGADLHATVAIGFEDAIRGTTRELTVTRAEACPACGGAGRVATAEVPCLPCDGTGTVRSSRGHMVFAKTCPACGGTGQQRQATCRRCDGHGLEPRTEVVAVRIPAGAVDGLRVRVAGKGHAGLRGGAPGDLLVTVAVQPHPLFRREGADVHVEIPVAIHEAALGARIEVPTPDGPARVRVPPGTQSGQRFRLRGRGVPTPHGARGDVVVEVRLVLPRLLDERSKELLREFGRINAASVRESPGESGRE